MASTRYVNASPSSSTRTDDQHGDGGRRRTPTAARRHAAPVVRRDSRLHGVLTGSAGPQARKEERRRGKHRQGGRTHRHDAQTHAASTRPRERREAELPPQPPVPNAPISAPSRARRSRSPATPVAHPFEVRRTGRPRSGVDRVRTTPRPSQPSGGRAQCREPPEARPARFRRPSASAARARCRRRRHAWRPRTARDEEQGTRRPDDWADHGGDQVAPTTGPRSSRWRRRLVNAVSVSTVGRRPRQRRAGWLAARLSRRIEGRTTRPVPGSPVVQGSSMATSASSRRRARMTSENDADQADAEPVTSHPTWARSGSGARSRGDDARGRRRPGPLQQHQGMVRSDRVADARGRLAASSRMIVSAAAVASRRLSPPGNVMPGNDGHGYPRSNRPTPQAGRGKPGSEGRQRRRGRPRGSVARVAVRHWRARRESGARQRHVLRSASAATGLRRAYPASMAAPSQAAKRTLPTGTVTFLFSDIEGSTHLVQSLGAAYRPVLERHQALLRAAFEEAGGVEIGTEGDSFFVAFASAPAAVAAAATAQRALAGETWPTRAGPVRVRMGAHGRQRWWRQIRGWTCIVRRARCCRARRPGAPLRDDAGRRGTVPAATWRSGPWEPRSRTSISGAAHTAGWWWPGEEFPPPRTSRPPTNLPPR